jgi:hypothetical protein
MFTFETTDQKEVRRFRAAQFNGRATTVTHDGSTVTGFVRSVLERKSSVPLSWSITIVPAVTRAKIDNGRPLRRVRPFAEDFC